MSGCVILDSGIVARKNGKRLPCEVLQAENAKLRELVRQSIYAMDDADWASIVSAAIGLGVEVDG